MSQDSTENSPDRSRRRFPGISSRAYEHPADRSALVALRSITGFDTLLRKLSGLLNERSLRLSLLADGVRVGEEQFRELHRMLLDSAATLDLAEVPEMYVIQDPMPSAMTIGLDRPTIVLSTGLVELMDAEEMRFAVAHEVGHALSGHSVYRTMLLWLTNLATNLSWLPMGRWGIEVIITALKEWFRKSELSCDRAGLLAVQDIEAGVRALMKMAGGAHLAEMSAMAFLEQARDHESGGGMRESVLKLLNLKDRTHPYTAVRALELTRWVESGAYQRILDGDYPRREDDDSASVRAEVKAAAASYAASFKETTDPLISKLRGFLDDASDVGDRIGEKIYRKWGPRRDGDSGGDGENANEHDGDERN
jgi:Zn-dependent protease with chaperone function